MEWADSAELTEQQRESCFRWSKTPPLEVITVVSCSTQTLQYLSTWNLAVTSGGAKRASETFCIHILAETYQTIKSKALLWLTHPKPDPKWYSKVHVILIKTVNELECFHSQYWTMFKMIQPLQYITLKLYWAKRRLVNKHFWHMFDFPT